MQLLPTLAQLFRRGGLLNAVAYLSGCSPLAQVADVPPRRVALDSDEPSYNDLFLKPEPEEEAAKLGNYEPSYRHDDLGFRLALSSVGEK